MLQYRGADDRTPVGVGFSRRELLTRLAWGAGSALVAPGLLELISRHALGQDAPTATRRKKLVILWLDGGPSQIDTFDPKPGSATNGPFAAIPTGIAGWQMSEHLPRLAARAEHLSVIRTLISPESSHGRASNLLHFGQSPNPSVDYPTLGAIAAHEIGDLDGELPAFVQVGGTPCTRGYLRAECAPFFIKDGGTNVQNLAYPEGVDGGRMDAREKMRAAVDAEFRRRGGGRSVDLFDTRRRAARRMMDSELRSAFDLSTEPQRTIEAYGAGDFGKGVLLARRLVERGVAAVEVQLIGWDTHSKNFPRTKRLCDQIDPAISTLIDELRERGLYDDTLIVCVGEFGRTPIVNADEGRDHWPNNFCALLAGGGIKPGIVVGETDERGETTVRQPVPVADLFATIGHVLGIDGSKEFNPNGRRPVKLIDPEGKIVSELVG